MSSLNKVYLMGNLTKDPELRYTPSGTAVARLGLAVNRKYTANNETKEETAFIDIDVWGKTAENCERYLSKGSQCLVEGRIKMDKWQDRNTGQKRSKLLVHADNVQFLSGYGSDAGQVHDAGYNAQEGGAKPYSVPDSDVPSIPPSPRFDPDMIETDDSIPF